MKIRCKLACAFVLIMSASCQAGRWQDLGRWLGYGYGDGYHACKPCASSCRVGNTCDGCQSYVTSTTAPSAPVSEERPHPTNVARRPKSIITNSAPTARSARPGSAEKLVAPSKRPVFSRQAQARPRIENRDVNTTGRSPMYQINDAWKPQSADLMSSRRLTNRDK